MSSPIKTPKRQTKVKKESSRRSPRVHPSSLRLKPDKKHKEIFELSKQAPTLSPVEEKVDIIDEASEPEIVTTPVYQKVRNLRRTPARLSAKCQEKTRHNTTPLSSSKKLLAKKTKSVVTPASNNSAKAVAENTNNITPRTCGSKEMRRSVRKCLLPPTKEEDGILEPFISLEKVDEKLYSNENKTSSSQSEQQSSIKLESRNIEDMFSECVVDRSEENIVDQCIKQPEENSTLNKKTGIKSEASEPLSSTAESVTNFQSPRRSRIKRHTIINNMPTRFSNRLRDYPSTPCYTESLSPVKSPVSYGSLCMKCSPVCMKNKLSLKRKKTQNSVKEVKRKLCCSTESDPILVSSVEETDQISEPRTFVKEEKESMVKDVLVFEEENDNRLNSISSTPVKNGSPKKHVNCSVVSDRSMKRLLSVDSSEEFEGFVDVGNNVNLPDDLSYVDHHLSFSNDEFSDESLDMEKFNDETETDDSEDAIKENLPSQLEVSSLKSSPRKKVKQSKQSEQAKTDTLNSSKVNDSLQTSGILSSSLLGSNDTPRSNIRKKIQNKRSSGLNIKGIIYSCFDSKSSPENSKRFFKSASKIEKSFKFDYVKNRSRSNIPLNKTIKSPPGHEKAFISTKYTSAKHKTPPKRRNPPSTLSIRGKKLKSSPRIKAKKKKHVPIYNQQYSPPQRKNKTYSQIVDPYNYDI